MIKIYTNDENFKLSEHMRDSFNSKKYKILKYSEMDKYSFSIFKRGNIDLKNKLYFLFLKNEANEIATNTIISENKCLLDFNDNTISNLNKDSTPFKLIDYTQNNSINKQINIYFFKEISISIAQFLIYFLVVPIVSTILYIVNMPSISIYDDLGIKEVAQIQALNWLIVTIYFLIIIFVIERKKYIDQLLSYDYLYYAKKIGLYFVIAMALTLVIGIISNYVTSFFDFNTASTSENQEILIRFKNSLPAGVFLFGIVISAPIVEEYIFRSLLLDRFLGFIKSNVFKVIICTVIFISIHTSTEIYNLFTEFNLENCVNLIITFLPYASVSLVLSYAYLKHRNIFITMGIHALFNFVGFLAMFV